MLMLMLCSCLIKDFCSMPKEIIVIIIIVIIIIIILLVIPFFLLLLGDTNSPGGVDDIRIPWQVITMILS